MEYKCCRDEIKKCNGCRNEVKICMSCRDEIKTYPMVWRDINYCSYCFVGIMRYEAARAIAKSQAVKAAKKKEDNQ